MGGASEPPTPAEPAVAQPAERILRAQLTSANRLAAFVTFLSSFIETLEDEISKENVNDATTCNAVETALYPPNYATTMMTPAAEHWKTAIESELHSLRDNRTWIAL
jgi:hypothetical protein